MTFMLGGHILLGAKMSQNMMDGIQHCDNVGKYGVDSLDAEDQLHNAICSWIRSSMLTKHDLNISKRWR